MILIKEVVKIKILYSLAFFFMNHSLYTMQGLNLFDVSYNRFIDGIDEFLSNKISYNQCVDYAQELKKYEKETAYESKVFFIRKYVNDLPESYQKSIQLKEFEILLNKLAAGCVISTVLLILAAEYLDPNDTLSAGAVAIIFPGYNYFAKRQEINGIDAHLKKYQMSKSLLDKLIQDLEGRKVSSDI